MREYLPALKQKRYAWAVNLLGGKCKRCGNTECPFEFDHIGPSTKTEIIALMWRFSEKKLLEELNKCQLLCGPCHRIKTCEDNGWEYSRHSHGLPSSHKYCDCDVCKSAWNDYQRERRIANGAGKVIKFVPAAQTPIKHGTYAGYQKEKRLKLKPCESCLAANNAYMKELKTRKTSKISERLSTVD